MRNALQANLPETRAMYVVLPKFFGLHRAKSLGDLIRRAIVPAALRRVKRIRGRSASRICVTRQL